MIRRHRVFALCLLWATPAVAGDWVMDPARSRLEFVTTYEKEAAPGQFRQFDTSLRFDPRKPAGGRLHVRVAVAGADMGSAELNDGMRTAEWFDTTRHPEAEFSSETIRATGEGKYEARGTLRLKGIARKLTVPFVWTTQGDNEALLSGELSLDRRLFQIGTGEWATDDPIGINVTLKYRVTFRRKY